MIALRPWSENDFDLLRKTVGDSAMMEHLGGPETSEQIAQRHARYLTVTPSGNGAMFTIALDAGAVELQRRLRGSLSSGLANTAGTASFMRFPASRTLLQTRCARRPAS